MAQISKSSGKAPPRGVVLAAASDLRFALEEILKEFAVDQPQLKVTVSYGSSGQFYAQLINYAPFDLFLSADIDYPKLLRDKNLALSNQVFSYGVGQIVVWLPGKPETSRTNLGLKGLASSAIKKIAIANPAHAPYGRAAEAALKSADLYEGVKSKLVLSENIAQAAQFVEMGGADAGILALSLALSPQMDGKGSYWVVPLDSYPPLIQGGMILKWAQDPKATEALRDFILGPKGQAILKRFGFLPPQGF